MQKTLVNAPAPSASGAPDAHASKLDLFGGISVVVGSILGSGIFIAPRLIANFSGSISIAILFWSLGGLVCAFGAMIYGSLGLLYPEGGGQYVYLRNSLGHRYSRFYGWVSLAVICPTMLAGTSLYFGELWKSFFPSTAWMIKGVAVGLIVFFTFLNTRGIQLAGAVQKLLVLLHVVLFIGVLLVSAKTLPGLELVTYPWFPSWQSLSMTNGILAVAAVLWSFEGFNAITFITNEIEGGETNVRKIGLVGCGIVLALYLLFNLVALSNVPLADLISQPNAAVSLMNMAFGAKGGALVFGLTILGIATVLHTSVIIGPRIITATAADGWIWKGFAKTDAANGAPTKALWLQCGAAVFYIFIGHFETLITCFIVLNWLFYGITAFGYFKLRFAQGSIQREKISGLTNQKFALEVFGGAVFLLMVALLLVSQFIDNPVIAAIGLVVFVIGVYVFPEQGVKLRS